MSDVCLVPQSSPTNYPIEEYFDFSLLSDGAAEAPTSKFLPSLFPESSLEASNSQLLAGIDLNYLSSDWPLELNDDVDLFPLQHQADSEDLFWQPTSDFSLNPYIEEETPFKLQESGRSWEDHFRSTEMSLDENGSGFACTSRTLSSLPSEPLSTTNASMQLEQQATGTSSLKRPRDESSSLSSSEGSRKHMRISRAHLCQWRSCSEGFETVAALRVHAHQHSWAEPACQWGTCSKPFDSLATLNKHLDTHIRDRKSVV